MYQIIKYSDINPDSLKSAFSQLSLEYLEDSSIIKSNIQSKSEEFLAELVYPDILSWYKKVDQEIRKNPENREMFISLSNESNAFCISGLMILKNTRDEKKICTLRVGDKYQGQGMGSEFLDKAIEFLGTNTPLITVPEESDKLFSKIFSKYGFEKTEEISGLYREGKKEYIYNGQFR
ncbi:GNAT family N-acetyltransferase [Rodentibacter haemolyticus]|uniref:GNAT family N-acetyltransferase n=1 Tax=Rodentibacter haemolyticus TaxID=2778911 RepID=A0ABX6UUL2_9PAST|nr:GNAT family N-acetyltransferase [Rodentibacter haemolyticus]QPB41678.1 GNAT family N-acetyltransferase [Rodentibacter haemolyticus]